MNKYTQVIHFYKRIFFILLAVNILLYLLFGMYLEEYESFFSAFLHGTYTHPWGRELDLSSHLFVLYIYELIASVFKDYNVYGLILVIYNFLGFIFAGLVLYRILKINARQDSLFIFLVLYLVLIIDCFINLNSTRQTFIFMVSMASFIESRRAENKPVSLVLCGWISLYYLLVSFIRFESVWLFCWIYLAVVVLHKKFNRLVLIPLIISGSILFIYYNVLIPGIHEPKQAYIYKEREFFDRQNINYTHLSPEQKMNVDAIILHGLSDEEFFTLSFYDSISKYNSNSNIFSLSDGVKLDAFRSTFHQSREDFQKTLPYFLFFLVTAFYLIWYLKGRKRKAIIHIAIVVAIPLALCLYTIVPVRFLIPYFAVFSVLNIVWAFRNVAVNRGLIWVTCIFLACFIFKAQKQKINYLDREGEFKENTSKLIALSARDTSGKPVIINSFYHDGFFPVKPLGSLHRQNAMVFNFYYFTAWDMNVKAWKNACHCNPLSLKEKTEYIISNQNLFIIDQSSFDFMKKYMKDKYGLLIDKTDVRLFNDDLFVCRLKYAQ